MLEIPEVARYQLVVRRKGFEDDLTLRVETAQTPVGLVTRLEALVREAIKLRTQVEVVPHGTLLQGGKKVLDERTWE